MTVHTRSRTRALSAFVVIVLFIGASFSACTNSLRQNGETCIKDEDCVSNNCASQVCAAAPPLFTGIPAGGSSDSGSGTTDASSGTDTGGGGQDSSSAQDSSGGDASADGPPADDGPGSDTTPNDVTDSGGDTADANESDASDASSAVADAQDESDSAVLDASLDLDVGLDALDDVNVPDVLGG
jgi:hypothetical protein